MICTTITVDTVAKKLRISKKTVYKYFSSKEDLARAVYDKYYYDMDIKINEFIENLNPSFIKPEIDSSNIFSFIGNKLSFLLFPLYYMLVDASSTDYSPPLPITSPSLRSSVDVHLLICHFS